MKYDCIVIGSGAGGLTVAFGLAGAGKKILLIEKSNVGGECTWSGCVPSKAFINLSKNQMPIEIALEEVRNVIKSIAGKEDPIVLKEKGIDYVKGIGKFIKENSIEVNGDIYTGDKIVIATGSSPFIPPIKGLEDINYLTNSNFFTQKTIPKKIVMIGGGVISLELSFALKRFGIEVTIYEIGEKLVPVEDAEISEFYKNKLEKEGIILYLNCGNIELKKEGDKVKVITENKTEEFDKLFISTGRVPNINGLDLEKAGVSYSKRGINVNENMLTDNKNIYAIGDVVGPYRFSHMAGYNGEIVVRNILFPYVKKKVDYRSIPWTIFTNPEFSRMGVNEREAIELKENIKIYKLLGKDNERSIISLEDDFYLKVICDKKFKVIGACCIGDRAGEIIGLLQFMNSQNLKFYKLMESIQAYPTYIDSLRKLSKLAYVDHLKELVKI